MTDLLKYARVERERRFLVAEIPGGAVEVRRIVDHYLDGTRLRLREVTAADGGVSRKLGQKVRLDDGPGEIACTSVYLNETEWEILRALPARILHKTRHIIERDGLRLAVDELEDGTLLAEIDDGGAAPRPLPSWLHVLREVTGEERWTGAQLARRMPDRPGGALHGAGAVPDGRQSGADQSARAPRGMTGLDQAVSLAENYRRFARMEAAGKSPLYEELARAVADDAQILAFLGSLPESKRQPNLLFAAARFLLGTIPTPATLRALIRDRGADLARVMIERRTQTNEAGRCAVLLPALAQLPEPLALIEVGAAAGLTLLHDLYSYDYAGHAVAGRDPAAPTLHCRPVGPVPLPVRVPEIAWRAGLDIHPLDVADGDDLEWLRCLIWPGDAERTSRLEAAARVARRHRPRVEKGDLIEDLPRLAAQAPQNATLVIFHTAVLAYVEPARRREFATLVADLGAVWLSNEAEGVLPNVSTERAHGDSPPGAGREPGFLLARDGVEILARADPHGGWLSWNA